MERCSRANSADGTVVQIDPQDGRVVGLVPVGHAPTDGLVGRDRLGFDTERERHVTELAIGIFPATISAPTSSISALSARSTAALTRRGRHRGSRGSGTCGSRCPASERLDRVEHGHVEPHQRARQDVPAQMGLVDIDADAPDSTLSRLQRPGPRALATWKLAIPSRSGSWRPTFPSPGRGSRRYSCSTS